MVISAIIIIIIIIIIIYCYYYIVYTFILVGGPYRFDYFGFLEISLEDTKYL